MDRADKPVRRGRTVSILHDDGSLLWRGKVLSTVTPRRDVLLEMDDGPRMIIPERYLGVVA